VRVLQWQVHLLEQVLLLAVRAAGNTEIKNTVSSGLSPHRSASRQTDKHGCLPKKINPHGSCCTPF
jgi:hypothetical protein